jgi:multisubunit Na+/H+ antiporter MnhB subunit
VSLGVSIPLTAIGAGIGGLQGLVLVWVGIVLLNFVYGWTHRRP